MGRPLSMSESITNSVVRLIAEQTGRGPTKARTTISPDVIIVTLRNVLSPSERKLVDHGQTTIVLNMRRVQQDHMSQQLIASIETITGRRVEAFLNDTLASPDITIEVFIMYPSD
jgi:uncharacterized protein YbcI